MKEIKRRFDITRFHSAYNFKWEHGHSYAGESHDFWEAVFVVSGNPQITENSNVYVLSKNEIIFHAPLEYHNIRAEAGETVRVLIFTFSASGELPQNITAGPFSLSSDMALDFNKLFNKIFTFYYGADDDYDGTECADMLGAFLIELDKSKIRHGSLISSHSASLYNNIINVMTEHACDNYSLEDIAAECHISVSYVKLLFKQFLGVSPKSYYASLRTNEAIRLLKSGMSAADVCEKMCFSSQGYFSAYIKKHTGFSPSSFQKQAPNGR